MIVHGIQIASLCVMLVLSFNYFTSKRLPLRSTKFFTCFVLLGVFNIIFEFITLYTISNLDIIPKWINRLAHQFFIGTIDLIIMMLFLYIDLKSRGEKKYSNKELIIRIIPFIITFFLIAFGDLKYNLDGVVYYSYGFMANTIYTLLVIYVILTIIIIIKHKKSFTFHEKQMIILSIISWAIITVVQFFNPTWLLSSLGISLMTLFLYMSFENNDKFLDNSFVFSRNAFDLIIKEYIENKKAFYIVNITLVNYDTIINQFGSNDGNSLFDAYSNYLSININGTCFNYKDKTISILFDKLEKYNDFINKGLDNIFEYKGISIKLVLNTKALDGCNYNSYDEIIKMLDQNISHIVGFKNDKSYKIEFKDIYYIEAVDNQTFIYTKDSFYEIKEKLYQIEMILNDKFLRCSKSMICNINKITSLEKEKNSRMIANLSNNETIIITRQYTKDIKGKLNL